MTDTLTRQERIDRAHRMICDLCEGRREWRMSIPAEVDYDPDLVIGDGLLAGREALAEVERLTRERDVARREAERWRGRARLSDPYMYDDDNWALPWKEMP